MVYQHSCRITWSIGSAFADISKLDLDWINRFRSRSEIIGKKIHGEAAAVNVSDDESWKTETLRLIRKNFGDRNFSIWTKLVCFGKCRLILPLRLRQYVCRWQESKRPSYSLGRRECYKVKNYHSSSLVNQRNHDASKMQVFQ